MCDRFEFEQDLLNCWNVVDDLKMLIKKNAINEETVEAIAVLYQEKFEVLWNDFENCCSVMDYSSKKTYGVEQE